MCTATAIPIQALVTANSAVDTCSTSRFGSRSATTPPHGVASTSATPKASNTPPSAAFDPVRPNASQPRATVCAITPSRTTVELSHNRRNSGSLNPANIPVPVSPGDAADGPADSARPATHWTLTDVCPDSASSGARRPVR
jgi:hypothetical protein